MASPDPGAMTMPIRSLENAPFLENLPLKEAKDPRGGGGFSAKFRAGVCRPLFQNSTVG